MNQNDTIKSIFIYILLLFGIGVQAQNISGKISDTDNIPIIGANIYWLYAPIGTVSDLNGYFSIPFTSEKSKQLVISYIGYMPDTIDVLRQENINVIMKPSNYLEQVTVVGKQAGTYVSSINPIKTRVTTQVELTKSACCDLAGCFNSEGSVQASTTNLITNSIELKILGLSGVYSQVLIDGMPLIHGSSFTYGISSYPGTLVDKISVSTGANSVLQGFESISGQINIDLKEPDNSEKLLVNIYTNSFLEKQMNINYTHKFKKWKSLWSVHTTQPANKTDRNEDGFLDLPLLSRYSVYNKWKYGDPETWGYHSMIGLRMVNEKRIGGQSSFDEQKDIGTTNSYGQTLSYYQPEIYTKSGYRIDDKRSIKFLSSLMYHNQSSTFGTSFYDVDQVSFYGNLQYELKWNKIHNFKAGLSYRYHSMNESIRFASNILQRTYDGIYLKHEVIPGIFAENVYNWTQSNLVLITGLRLDNHNKFGLFLTPRALLKYDISEKTTARMSVGTGYRTVNVFSENIGLMASSRDIIIADDLEPEKAVNVGFNLTTKFDFSNTSGTFGLDFYHTQFSNQIFPDYNKSSSHAYLQNFTGTSISNGFQAEVNLNVKQVIDFKISYNLLDVFKIVDNDKIVLPFNAKHKIISALSYRPISDKWHIDLTAHWFGKQVLANTLSNPIEYQTGTESSPYIIINTQLTKSWNALDLYLGVENMFDFKQQKPILNWQNPFDRYFDTSNVWGPTKGRELYIGLRYKLRKI